MSHSTRARRTGALVAALVVALSAPAAAAPPQTVDAGGLTFEAPASWKSTPPASRMRRAQLAVPAAEGDGVGAELIVFAFPGGAGGVQANVDRWRKTFKDAQGSTPEAAVTTVKGKNVDVTRVEIAGDYTPTAFPGQAAAPPIAGARLLGAIATTPDETGYFLRLVGPEKTVKAALPDFDKLVASMQAAGK